MRYIRGSIELSRFRLLYPGGKRLQMTFAKVVMPLIPVGWMVSRTMYRGPKSSNLRGHPHCSVSPSPMPIVHRLVLLHCIQETTEDSSIAPNFLIQRML